MSETNKRVAVVTGANKGIGLAIVKRLCREFDGIVYLTARNVDRGTEAIRELEKLGLKAQFHQLDVEDKQSIERLAAYLKQTHGGLDILINNAGVFSPDEPIVKQAVQCESINLVGLFNVCNALFPLMKKNGRVVHVSSRLGMLSEVKDKTVKQKLANRQTSTEDILKIMRDYVEACKNGTHASIHKQPYGLSKACVNALTRNQQKELDAEEPTRNIIVFAVCPNYCKTELTNNKGILTPNQGAETPVYLALTPADFSGPRGEFWGEKNVVNWETGSMTIQILKSAPLFLKTMLFVKE